LIPVENVDILDNIPFKLESSKIKRWMRTHADGQRLDNTLDELRGLIEPLARPKAIVRSCRVGETTLNIVTIEGIEFKGSMLLVNLRKGMQVFPFVATCGQEVEDFKIPSSDFIHKYVLDVIKLSLLISAINFAKEQVMRKYHLDQLSTMNPGELESWPIDQQQPLFTLLGDVENSIGVRLNRNFGMIPLKSRSGLFFPSESKFENCQFCTRQRCVGRRAAFDPDLANKFKSRVKGICG
jgi:hypothetical protein